MDRLPEQTASDWEPLPEARPTDAGPTWLDRMPAVEMPVISRSERTSPAPAIRGQLRSLADDQQWQRLLLISVPLPLVIVGLTEGLLRHAALAKWDFTSGMLVYGLLIGQVALLSTLVGKLISSWPWRLAIRCLVAHGRRPSLASRAGQ